MKFWKKNKKESPQVFSEEYDGPILSFRNVSCSTEFDNLTDFSVDIYKGENIVFFGPESCGKDLIMPLGTGMMVPDSGQVLYNGVDLNSIPFRKKYALRKNFGYLLKGYGLINNLSIENNILLPLRYHYPDREQNNNTKLTELLNFFDLYKKKDMRPISLSESEKLRASYIRALILEPKIIFFDNAFSGQDPMKLESFLELVEVYFYTLDTAFIVVTYLVEKFLNHSEKFCMLNDGKIVYEGNGKDTDNNYFNQFLGSSLKGPINN